MIFKARAPLPPTSEVTDLVWLQTSFLGDIVITTAALELAKRLMPQVRQHLITTGVGRAALAGSTTLASITVFDKKSGSPLSAFRAVADRLKPELRNRSRTVLLKPHMSYRSSLLAAFLGFPTITYREASLAFLATATVPRLSVWHEASRIALLLEPLGFSRAELHDVRPRLEPLPLAGGEGWQHELKEFRGRLVGVAPGSVWATKRWTTEGFTAVVKGLLEKADTGIVLLGSGAEKEVADQIVRSIGPRAGLWNLAGQTNLDDLRRIMPRLSLVIANDSSPIHYASAFDVPTVAVFGATVPAMGFGPLAGGSVTLGVDGLPCRPCSDHGPKVCPLTHFRCMRDLSAATVLAASLARLKA